MSNNEPGSIQRKVNPLDIHLLPGYTIEIIATGINAPVNVVFDKDGNMLIGESGEFTGEPRVMRLVGNKYELVADGFNFPLSGINYLNGDIYVSHRGAVTVVREDGSKENIITGLPSMGDHTNTKVAFGSDNKMYFGQGSATNSGVVGLDNIWAVQHPFFHDYSAEDILLIGQNFITYNFLSADTNDYAFTGAYRQFGTPNKPNTLILGTERPTSAIYRADMDGSNLEVFAWGIRRPEGINFDIYGRLYVSNDDYDDRGSRPIENCPDELYLIENGMWYGFPDFTAGMPVTNPYFKPDVGPQPEFLMKVHPMIPPSPVATFEPHSTVRGFDFNYDVNFGPYGDAYIAEFGSGYPISTGGYPLPGVG